VIEFDPSSHALNFRRRIAGAILLLGLACGLPPASAQTLPLVDGTAVTVSGISSGGAMAQQLQFAYADRFSGAGIIAGVPYGCAEGDVSLALGRCMGQEEGDLPLEQFRVTLAALASAGKVSDASLLAGHRAWVFHGTLDAAVGEKATAAAAAIYEGILPPGQRRYLNDVPAAHLFPTQSAGVACDQAAAPWIGACGYDAAGEMLAFLYPGLETPAEADLAPVGDGEILELALPEVEGSGLAKTALAWFPESCPPEGCRLHLALHGCAMSTAQNGRAFVEDAGYLPWARANSIILLFPQVEAQALNPLGCWDWWGYTGEDYLTREAPQMKSLVRWIGRFTAQ
jgi:poly(3-hydroxybutyrate) depolymerase